MAQAPSPGAAAEPDPSMDDILASIRRILNDDDKAAKAPAEGVLMLDPSMMVDDGQPVPPAASELMQPSGTDERHVQPEPERATLATPTHTAHSDLSIDDGPATPPTNAPRDSYTAPAASLVAPAAAAAAATSVDALMRTLAAERSAAVSRGLVTIEDLVREEIRPLLKAWLDHHLPPVVERLVQAEIERVVGRNAG